MMRPKTLTVTFALLVCALFGVTSEVMADIPGHVFELEGNAAVDGPTCTAPGTPAGCKDDWNLLNGTGTCSGTGCQPGAAGGSIVRDFISGSAVPTIFTGGGSKDPLDIPSWKWKGSDTGPDKDTITNGYAAAYQSPHLILTFGADRFAQNGDANIGVWFFQDDVHPIGTAGGTFSGHHVNNDVFVVSAFTQGGGISVITAYAWDSACSKGVKNPTAGSPAPDGCAESNLRLIYDSVTQGSCGANTYGCAEVNTGPIPVSWPYLAKFGNNSQVIPAGGFYEAGIDLTDILPGTFNSGNLPCFTSWLVETRSSQTPSAVLKDFVSGGFPLCGLSATKSCSPNGSTVNPDGGSIHYVFDGTVTNSGVGTLDNVVVVDSLPSGSTNVQFYKGTPALPPSVPGDPITQASAASCPPGAPPGAVCADLGTLLGGYVVKWSVAFDSTSLSPQNNAYAAGVGGISLLVFSDPVQASCSTSPNNSITISKNCGIPLDYPGNSGPVPLPGTQLVTSGGVAAVQVNFSGEVCNTGQTPLTGAILTDNPNALFTPSSMPTIAVGACAKYSGHYLPSGVTSGDLGGSAGRYGFADQIKVTGATATLGASPGHDTTCTGTFAGDAQACANATCNICPGTATCSGP